MLLKLTKILAFIGLFCITFQVMAFPCFITLVKGSCWKNYDVHVDVLDADNDKVLLSLDIPKGTLWARKSFDAPPKQRFIFRARFTPVFWKTEKGAVYYAKRYWALPESVEGETLAWHVGACFPSEFSSVPMPPDAGQDCSCDKQSIPPVKAADVPS